MANTYENMLKIISYEENANKQTSKKQKCTMRFHLTPDRMATIQKLLTRS